LVGNLSGHMAAAAPWRLPAGTVPSMTGHGASPVASGQLHGNLACGSDTPSILAAAALPNRIGHTAPGALWHQDGRTSRWRDTAALPAPWPGQVLRGQSLQFLAAGGLLFVTHVATWAWWLQQRCCMLCTWCGGVAAHSRCLSGCLDLGLRTVARGTGSC
jgi:hypothetical protein